MLKRIEKIAVTVLILCVLCLSAYNILRNVGGIEQTSNSKAKDVLYTESYYYKDPCNIKLSINTSGNYSILVNGDIVQTEMTAEGYDVFAVYDGDIVSIDLRECEKEVGVFIAYVSENVAQPEIGTKMFVKGGIKNLFKVETIKEN